MNSDNSPAGESATRTGKVARLPDAIREELNRRIQNGEEGKNLIDWLNSLPEAQAVLAAQFDGQPITDSNFSRWKSGGYRDWEAKQEAIEFASQFCAGGPDLARSGAASLADHLAFRAGIRIALLLRDSSPLDEAANRQVESLGKLCRQVAHLRRGDHEVQKLQIQREKLALLEQQIKDQAARSNKAAEERLLPATLEDFKLFEERENL